MERIVYIYVGNLDDTVTDERLRDLFQTFGETLSAVVMRDRFRGIPRGFGFVEMPEHDGAEKAISSLDGSMFAGRKIIVAVARSRKDGPRQGRGGSPPKQ